MSGRIRTVKPEWLEDEKIALASSDARVLSIALVLLADDYGNGRAHPGLLRGRVFQGGTNDQVSVALNELVAIRFIDLYESEGQRYFSIRNWNKHQRVDKPGKARVPSPPRSADSESGTVPVARPQRTPENIPEAPKNIPGTLATDHDHDHDPEGEMDQRPTTTPEVAVVGPRDSIDQVPCPGDLCLTAAQISTHITALVPAWAIPVITLDFIASAQGNPDDKRTMVVWRKCLSKAISGRWSDASKRPKQPSADQKTSGTNGYGKKEDWL